MNRWHELQDTCRQRHAGEALKPKALATVPVFTCAVKAIIFLARHPAGPAVFCLTIVPLLAVALLVKVVATNELTSWLPGALSWSQEQEWTRLQAELSFLQLLDAELGSDPAELEPTLISSYTV